MTNAVGFSYGVLSDMLEEQANKQGYTLGDEATRLEKLKEARNMLFLHNVITDLESSRVTKRINKEVLKALQPLSD